MNSDLIMIKGRVNGTVGDALSRMLEDNSRSSAAIKRDGISSLCPSRAAGEARAHDASNGPLLRLIDGGKA